MLRDQTVAELYALRDCIMYGNSRYAEYLSSSSNPALQDRTDAALVWLRDELMKRYPVPPTVTVQEKIVYVDRPVDRIVYVDKPVEKIVYVDREVIKEVQVPTVLLSTEAKVSDQQVLTVPVLNTLGVSLGTKARISVAGSALTGIRLV